MYAPRSINKTGDHYHVTAVQDQIPDRFRWVDKVVPYLIVAGTCIGLAFCGNQAPAFGKESAHREPPARFMHKYTGKLTVQLVSNGMAAKVCEAKETALYGPQGSWPDKTKGCAFAPTGDYSKECSVISTRGKPHVLRHEIAHCNSWPADHPR